MKARLADTANSPQDAVVIVERRGTLHQPRAGCHGAAMLESDFGGTAALMSMIPQRAGRAALLALAFGGCLDFRGVGPEEAPQVSPPKTVRVTIEYTRPSDCILPCDGPVTFAASWMRPGAGFPLVS